MTTLTVNIPGACYPIFFEPDVLSRAELLAPYITAKTVMIVTNDHVSQWYLAPLQATLEAAGFKVDVLELPDGEAFKTLETLNLILTALLEKQHGRDTTVIALGGGVTGDMAGFSAAVFQRGVRFIQIPTTLLAQVDSSVGGKTGVNHPLGKNMIGAFYQPAAVLIDVGLLKTLPAREIRAGLAEVIKYGFIWDADFLSWIEDNVSGLLAAENQILTYAVTVSCDIKAQVVAQDEKEGGIRAILNFGHTFGHAIEAALGYGQWLHGEAVALGMLMACHLCEGLNLLPSGLAQRCQALLQRFDLPVYLPPELQSQQAQQRLIELMQHDKKVLNAKVRFVVLERVGRAQVRPVEQTHLIQAAIASCMP